MAEQQKCKKLAAVLVEHQDYFAAMSDEDCQSAIQHPKDAIARFVGAWKDRAMETTKKLLDRLAVTISLSVMKEFVAKKNFVINTSDKAKVKISGFGDNFKKHLLPKVEKSEVAAEELAVNKLLEYAYDSAIITYLGGEPKVEISLGQFFAAFAKQPNGEDGPLRTDGYANVGYVRDENGVLWAVNGRWYGGGWDFEAHPLDYPNWWFDGRQFLSR